MRRLLFESDGAFPRGRTAPGEIFARGTNIRLKLTFSVLIATALFCWFFPGESRADAALPWRLTETPVATGPGDQMLPALDGDQVVFLDRGATGDSVITKNLGSGEVQELLSGATVWAGPAIDDGRVAWQTSGGQACLRELSGAAERCIAAPQAEALSLSGSKALIHHSGSTIRLLDFDVMRSRMLDSYDLPDMRFDPVIDGGQAVWVKERGYAGKYYEPLITSYDLASSASAYLTATGGGTSSGGGSRYLRRHPSLSGGRVLYQQKLNEAGEQWDIYSADVATFGVPVVQEQGDQVNPSLSGDLVAYQDNRNGHFDETGKWVDDWNIYVKDLTTGGEQPVCTAAGDQVNPVLKGNTVVWQDNRGGDWDVYSAELETAEVMPELTLSIEDVYWGSLAEFEAGSLSVRYMVANPGDGAATEVSLNEVVSSPSQVAITDALPLSMPAVEPGGSIELLLHYQVPSGVTRFSTTLYAGCKDGSGSQVWFPEQPPG